MDRILDILESTNTKATLASPSSIVTRPLPSELGWHSLLRRFRLVPYPLIKSWSAECANGYKNHMVPRIWHDSNGNMMMGDDGLPVTRDVGYLLGEGAGGGAVGHASHRTDSKRCAL